MNEDIVIWCLASVSETLAIVKFKILLYKQKYVHWTLNKISHSPSHYVSVFRNVKLWHQGAVSLWWLQKSFCYHNYEIIIDPVSCIRRMCLQCSFLWQNVCNQVGKWWRLLTTHSKTRLANEKSISQTKHCKFWISIY